VACFAFGVTSFVLGDDDTARSVLVEGSAEACIFGSASLEAQCSAAHAFVLASAGDWSSAEPLARSARALQRLHGLDDRPIMALVPAVSALVEARHGDPKAARADAALARRSIAHLSAGGGRPGLLARIALAEANLVLGDRVAASTLLDEARQLSDSIAGTGPVGDLIECLADRLRRGAATLPYEPSALTTAELRVLHYLPTNLTLAKIAELHYISRNTAKSHAAAVYRKLGVNSRSEAVDLARMIGLLPDDGSAATD
jgi:LuxR family maltose regulon positive regulatory protein